MQRTRIEWVRNQDGSQGYTINPVKGLCPMACSYCYARAMYKRFKWNPEIRYEDPFYDFYSIKKKPPSRVFVGSTIELFGDWICPEWLHNIFSFCQAYPQHTFIFLTKQPQNLIRWCPFPKNCWVGATVTDQPSYEKALKGLSYIGASIRYISFEPLLEPVQILGADFRRLLHWVIVGGQSGKKKFYPPEEWIQEIELACDKARIPIFEKDNLRKESKYFIVRQEMPK